MLYAGLAGFVDDVLDERSVDHRQHFLRHRLSGRQKSRSKPCNRENSFSYQVSWITTYQNDLTTPGDFVTKSFIGVKVRRPDRERPNLTFQKQPAHLFVEQR